MGPAAVEKIRRENAEMLFVDPSDGCVYVEARAVIESCGSEWLTKWLRERTDDMVDALHPSNWRR